MKRVILAVGVAVLIASGVAMIRSKTPSAHETAKVSDSPAASAEIQRQETVKTLPELPQTKGQPMSDRKAAAAPQVASRTGFDLNQSIETLISPQASYRDKQAVWNALKEAGQLDQAINELEQRMANDPQRPEYVAALGEAYMKKCAGMTDVREQAILAMKADKTLETALKLDPSNWEARFIKAVGMSFWPADLNKNPEVVQEFRTLIQQQEAQPAQPQFAQPYIWLGKEYEKAGQAEDAAQVWQRGAALFPENKELQNKLASAQH